MSIWLEPKIDYIEPHFNQAPIITARLVRLGFTTEHQAVAFIDPAYYNPSPPSELPGLREVANRIETAIQTSELICVWGDFDVDGQISTTILVSTLQDLGARVTFHIPVRGPESHGIGIPSLKNVIEQGVKLILTCDTGITAHEAVDYANSQGVDVVITDHHDLPPEIPAAFAATNPKFLPADHPLSTLAGAGVAYKLAEELFARIGQRKLVEKHLDLTALGLVADLAVLKGDTRYLVQRGLEALKNTHRVGLQVLMEMAGLNTDHLTEEHIGFIIGPRLNALGRLADANIAVELFTTSDQSRAKVICTILEGLNAHRQLLTNQVYSAAETQINDDPSILDKAAIVLAHATWPAGIIGIAASRLVEHYNRPVILISSPPDEPGRGSARSIDGINITDAIAAYKDILLGFGGHPLAAGLSIDSEKIPEFQLKFTKSIAAMMSEKDLKPTIQLDGFYDLDDLSIDLADSFEKLAPFGPGNQKLILVTKNLRIINSSRIGRHKDHIKFLVEDNKGTQQSVLWWSAGDEELPEGMIDLAYNLRASDWKGTRQIQLEFVDHRPSLQAPDNPVISKIEIVDLREKNDFNSIFRTLPEGTLVWAEGEERSLLTTEFKEKNAGLRFVDRNDMVPCINFAIWTSPPSPKELRMAMDNVNPDKVFLLRGLFDPTSPDTFIGQLMGLIKFTLNHREGKITYPALAAATAQRESTVRSALNWMIFKGEVSITEENGKEITLEKGTSPKDPIRASRYWNEVRNMLIETNAYRSYFIHADKYSLFT